MHVLVKWIILPGVAALAAAIAKELIEDELLKAEAERRYVALGLGG